jgi:MraZ protein
MSFRGTFDYTLDGRYRLPLPPRYRDQFTEGAVLVSGVEPCVLVYTQGGFEDAESKARAIPEESDTGREALRDFFANAYDTDRDNQGRILIPEKLRAHAGLEKGVALVGVGDYMEIWDRDAWAEREQGRKAARKDETAAMGRRRSGNGREGVE